MKPAPNVDSYLSLWLPKTEDFSSEHFRNCVDILHAMRSKHLEFPNFSSDGKREFPDPLERFSAKTNSFDMFKVLRDASWSPPGELQYYGCLVCFIPGSRLHPVRLNENGILFTGGYC